MGKKKHSVNMLFSIMLLGIFALTATFVAIMGAKVYENSANKMQENFDTRTSIVYLSEKIRTCPKDDYAIRDVDGNTALVLSNDANDTSYESWIFVRDGKLCEATVVQGDKILPEAAQKIMSLKAFDAELKNGGIELTVTTSAGEICTTFISGRTGQ